MSEGGPNLIFLVGWGIEDPNTAINGPSSARQRNAVEMEMTFRWRAEGAPKLNAGLVAMCFFRESGQ